MVEDKLLDLYGISKAEAKHYWLDAKYIDVLQDKINRATKLKGKLVDVHYTRRDNHRIMRVSKAIDVYEQMLEEMK